MMKTTNKLERVAKGLALLAALVIYLGIICACSGCIYKGAKINEGVNLVAGINVPITDGALQVNALDWCTGFRMGVAENAAFKCRYTCATTNSFFGVIHTFCFKTIDAEVSPCETGAGETSGSASGKEAE